MTDPLFPQSRKPSFPFASLFYPDDKFVPSGQTLNLYFTRLALTDLHMAIHGFVLEMYKTGI
jgi:hypothetical protein